MLIHEYRVILPLTVEEYQVGLLYSVAELSKAETGGGEGIEIVKNEPFENHTLMNGKYTKGQYTLKIYHVQHKIPTVMRFLLPRGLFQVYEESWNAYPYTKTVLTNPGYMKDAFELIIESFHYGDRGIQENILNVPKEILDKREVTVIDIANDPVSRSDYNSATDPSIYKSVKTGRGPLVGNWIETVSPVMTCYKLVTINFKWFGLQKRVERFVQNFEQRLFTVFHRQVFCSTDEWYGMTLDQVRVIEDATKEILDRERTTGPMRGTRS